METASVSGVRLGQAVRDNLDEFFEIERLEDRVADSLRRDLVDATLSGGREHDDVRTSAVGILGAYVVDEFVTVDFWHHQIEQDQIDFAVAFQLFEADRPVLGELDVESHPLQDRLKKN